MTEREDFLARWSRLKRAGAAASSGPRTLAPGELPAGSAAAATASPNFDIASLPPIESLTAESDVRPFMQAGVPAQLQQAALRAAWVADPIIRDFIGIADSQWDFNDPAAMPGFGPLEGAETAQLFAQRAAQLRTGPATLSALTEPLPQLAGSRRDGQLDRVWLSCSAPEKTPPPVETNSPVALQPMFAAATEPRPQPDPQQPVGIRRHGSALPKST
jgi:Protein of unknown function (DUF3306)